MGVWIETRLFSACENEVVSHPSWVCGLKHGLSIDRLPTVMSHPSWVCGLKQTFWISISFALTSHPSWVCGLKLLLGLRGSAGDMSHPSWVCGLKRPQEKDSNKQSDVTPFVGVWIETSICF